MQEVEQSYIMIKPDGVQRGLVCFFFSFPYFSQYVAIPSVQYDGIISFFLVSTQIKRICGAYRLGRLFHVLRRKVFC
jgi:hypothetical protein